MPYTGKLTFEDGSVYNVYKEDTENSIEAEENEKDVYYYEIASDLP